MPHRRVRLVSLIVLAVSLSIHVWDLSRPGLVDRTGRLKVPDFLQFYTYGSLIHEGRSRDLYDAGAHARVAARRVDRRLALTGFHPNYSPVIALLMSPLAALTFLQAAAVWSSISLLLYGIAVALLTRTTTTLRADPLTIALLAASWPAVFVVLRYGQISALSLVCLAAAVWLHKKGNPFASGIALGLLAYKPNLLIAPALILLLARERRLVVRLVVSGSVLELAVAVAVVGPAAFAEYVEILIALARRPELVELYSTESHSFRGRDSGHDHRRQDPLRGACRRNRIRHMGGLAYLARQRRHAAAMERADPRHAVLEPSPADLRPALACGAAGADRRLAASRHPRGSSSGRSGDREAPGHAAWRTAMILLYIGAWPGTLLARMYGRATVDSRDGDWPSGSWRPTCVVRARSTALALRPP